jgi:Barstar (barnase inhibitor)
VIESKEELESFRAAVADEAFGLFELDGNRARSKDDLLDQLADVMSLPSYFGNNWDGFAATRSLLHGLPSGDPGV